MEILFQLLLKGCTIEARNRALNAHTVVFQLLLKGCTIEAHHGIIFQGDLWVSVVVERMYD